MNSFNIRLFSLLFSIILSTNIYASENVAAGSSEESILLSKVNDFCIEFSKHRLLDFPESFLAFLAHENGHGIVNSLMMGGGYDVTLFTHPGREMEETVFSLGNHHFKLNGGGGFCAFENDPKTAKEKILTALGGPLGGLISRGFSYTMRSAFLKYRESGNIVESLSFAMKSFRNPFDSIISLEKTSKEKRLALILHRGIYFLKLLEESFYGFAPAEYFSHKDKEFRELCDGRKAWRELLNNDALEGMSALSMCAEFVLFYYVIHKMVHAIQNLYNVKTKINLPALIFALVVIKSSIHRLVL